MKCLTFIVKVKDGSNSHISLHIKRQVYKLTFLHFTMILFGDLCSSNYHFIHDVLEI